MQLKLIQANMERYKTQLSNQEDAYYDLYKWETQRSWQENWNLDADDLVAMYDRSLQNSVTQRIWNREHVAPKKMMLAFAKQSPHLVFFMFQDLFNEEKEIGPRIERFQHHCVELFNEYKEQHPHDFESGHYHDYELISHYLAFQYPTFYTPYSLSLFQKLLRKIGSRDIPQHDDLARYFKVTRTLFNFLQKDKELIQLHQQRLSVEHYQSDSLLLVEDFARQVTHDL